MFGGNRCKEHVMGRRIPRVKFSRMRLTATVATTVTNMAMLRPVGSAWMEGEVGAAKGWQNGPRAKGWRRIHGALLIITRAQRGPRRVAALPAQCGLGPRCCRPRRCLSACLRRHRRFQNTRADAHSPVAAVRRRRLPKRSRRRRFQVQVKPSESTK